MVKYEALFFTFLLSLTFIGADAQEVFGGRTFSYQEIGKENLKSLQTKNEFKIPVAAGGSIQKFIERQKNILFNLTARLKNTISFSLLNAHEEKFGPLYPSIIDATTRRDLHILAGSDKNPGVYLGQIINKTHTQLGKASLLATIARPLADVNVLKTRQDIVKQFRPELLEQIDPLLEVMAQGEGHLLSFWNKGLQLPGTIRKQYFRFNQTLDKYLNTSPIALEIKAAWETTQSCLKVGMQALSAVFLTAYSLSYILNEYVEIETPFQQQLENYATRFTGTAGPIYAILAMFPWLQCGTSASVGVLNTIGLPSALAWMKADLSVGSLLQKKLVYVARYVKHMQEIYHVLKENPAISSRLLHFKQLQALAERQDPQLNKLLDTLASGTFTQEAEFFYRRGNVNLAFELLRENEHVRSALVGALAAMAEIDMYSSIANLYHQFERKRVNYCFPTYLDNQTHPLIKLENYWNPFVDPERVVTNSTILGDKEQTRNAVITGPNSAGKSTILKAIALSILLAQSIGIVPAQAMEFTPFTHVATYMEVAEEIAEKASLFQAEVDRALKLQKTIASLGPHQFSFTIFDEIFSGTSPKEGMAMAYATAEAIGRFANSISMIATHYELLTTLEKQTPYFSNYHVAVRQKSRGKGKKKRIIRTYKLVTEPSTQHFALAIAKERGASGNIMDRAKEILEQLNQTP